MRRGPTDPVFAEAPEAPARPCDHPGCIAGGDFPAPRSRLELDRYFWFCREHVRTYNAAWNYYAGMSAGEIEAEIRRDTVWQRPSWRFGLHPRARGAQARDPFGFIDGEAAAEADGGRHRQARQQRPLSAREQALAVFGIEPPITAVRLKARYKVLVKEHHPDTHGGDKSAEEKLKIINQAYATLKASFLG